MDNFWNHTFHWCEETVKFDFAKRRPFQHNTTMAIKSDAGPRKRHLPVVNLFLTRESLYSWLLSSKFSLEMVAPLHVNWTAMRDGVLGPCDRSNLALKEPNKSLPADKCYYKGTFCDIKSIVIC